MLNLRRLKDSTNARPSSSSKPDGRCKKHPKHKQSPGVCSVCLSEKLSRLATSKSPPSSSSTYSSSTTMDCNYYSSSSSSASSYYYSSSSGSSRSSPMRKYRSAVKGQGKGPSFLSSLFFLSSGRNVLTNSRSVALVPKMSRGNNKDESGDDERKRGGFWSKLLRPRSRNKWKEEGLMHSRTTRERVIIVN